VDGAQVDELKRFAQQLEGAGGGEETRAAARAILLLADEVESLRRELAGGASRGDEDDVASWSRCAFSTDVGSG
jgi:hypothetical protein